MVSRCGVKFRCKATRAQNGRSIAILKRVTQANVQASLNPHRLHTFTASTAVWLFVRDPKSLDEVEQENLATFCQASPTLKRTYDLVQDFMHMVRKREGHRLDAWLERVATSDLAERAAICGWSGEGQSRCESGPHLVHQQRSGRGTGNAH